MAPERLAGWVERFAGRHGGLAGSTVEPERVVLTAADGSVAECRVPFPPLPGARPAGPDGPADPAADPGDPPGPAADPGGAAGPGADPGGPAGPAGGLVAHALVERRVGVLLVRLGGHAAGVFAGERLVASKVGSRLVHGRSAAGGQSQQRFARRREGQARVALAAAADVAAAVLLPAAPTLDAVVLGGDRRAVDGVLADPRLAPLRPLAVAARLDVPDPRLKVLQATPALFRAVRIRVTESG